MENLLRFLTIRTIIIILSSPFIIYIFYQSFKLIFAKQIAINKNKKVMNFFGGLLKLVIWEPNEGVIILRYKQPWKRYPMDESTYAKQGGFTWLNALKGEELRAHFPLKDRALIWESSDISTKEGIEIFLKINIFWKVNNLEKFVFDIGQNIRIEQDSYHASLVTVAEERIKTITESNIRDILASSSIVILNPTNVANYLMQIDSSNTTNSSFIEMQTGKQGDLEKKLTKVLNDEIEKYGIYIEKIKIEKTRLPDKIQNSLDEVYLKALEPISAKLTAETKKIETESKYQELKASYKAQIAALTEELGAEIAAKIIALEKIKGLDFEQPKKLDELLNDFTFKINVEGNKKGISK